MALSVNFWRLGTKTVRVVSADGLADEPTEGVPSGATLWRTDVGASRAWNGEAWASSGGGAAGPPGQDGADGAPGLDGADSTVPGPKGDTGNQGAPGLGFGAVVKLSADLSAFTATALADVTGLSFALTSGRFYSFQFWIRFSTAATTTGAQFAINAPANSYIVYRTETSLTAAAAGAPTFRTARAVNIGTASASVDAIGGDLLCLISGVVKPSAGGTLVVRAGTEVAGSGVTVKAGSCGILMDYGA